MILRCFTRGEGRGAEPRGLRAFLMVCVLFGAPGSALSATFNGTPANYQSLVNGLQPGDTLVLAPGTYPNGLSVLDLHGTAGQPIVITGPEFGEPAVFTGRSCCNTVQIQDSSHIGIRHLKLDGLGIDGIDGVNGRGVTHHITIANFHIVGHGGGQQTNGISTKGPAWDWVIRENVIEGAGTGMYLGNSDGNLQFVNGIIERNLIVDTIGYNMQVKHQNPRPAGIGMPTGISRTVIRHNVFSKSDNSSTGGLARPNLLVGHFPLSGPGMDDIYEIYGNFFWQNPTESLFQGEGNIAMYGNLFVTDGGTAVAIQSHNDVPRRVLVFRNTVVAGGTGIRVANGASGYERRVFANAVFAGTPLSLSSTENYDNVTGARAGASSHLRAPFAAPGALDLSPLAGALDGAGIDLGPAGTFTDHDLDFETRPMPAGMRGAYAGAAEWLPQLQIKPLPGALPVVTFDASATTVAEGEGVQLSWNAGGADTCTADGAWSGPRALSGSEPSGPLDEDSTFVLSCSGAGGTTSRSVSVSVGEDAGDGGGTPVGGDVSDLVLDLAVQDVTNAPGWSVRTNLQSGDRMFGDRPYDIVTLPDGLAGADWIQTANDSRDFSDQILANFVTGAPVEVFVAHRDDIDPKPSWLDQWTETGLQLVNDEPRSHTLYRRVYAAGANVTLGPNGDSSSGMYLVLVRAAPGGGVPGEDPEDPPEPYQPVLPLQTNQPTGAASLAGAPFADPNGGDLTFVRWEIADDSNDRIVYRHDVAGPNSLRVPAGVLVAGERYRVRVRHQSSLGLLSAWSDHRTFEAQPWNDADLDGVHDLYQDDLQIEDAVCQMRHPEAGSVELVSLSLTARIRCLVITETGDLELAQDPLTADAAPFGFPAFRLEGLPAGAGSPAQVSVVLFLPSALASGSRWYEFDRAEGRLADASARAGGLAETSRQVMVTLTDGGAGDADGVVNGIIVTQGGVITSAGAQQVVSGTDSSGAGGGGGDGGAGMIGLTELLAFLLLLNRLWQTAMVRSPRWRRARPA